MKPAAHKRARWLLLLVIPLLATVYPVQQSILHDERLPQEYLRPFTPPLSSIREGGTITLMAMMGGFRPLVGNLLWLKADKYWHTGGAAWWRMWPILQAVCEMNPRFIDAWSIFGWHCAWNLYVNALPEDRPRWLQAGIDIYKRGISFNPDRYDLYKDLAWLYHDKMRDYDRAAEAWQDLIERFPDAPIYTRHMLAHCYENTWQVDKAVAVWKECLEKDPWDNVAKSALDWWSQQTATPELLEAEKRRILERENKIRSSRDLPMMEQPAPFR